MYAYYKNEPYFAAPACPNCGQQDKVGEYKGARMSSSSWAHTFACCSHVCGVAFALSPTRYQMELDVVQEQIALLKEKEQHWKDRLAGKPIRNSRAEVIKNYNQILQDAFNKFRKGR